VSLRSAFGKGKKKVPVTRPEIPRRATDAKIFPKKRISSQRAERSKNPLASFLSNIK
jgi:hypothetical protein